MGMDAAARLRVSYYSYHMKVSRVYVTLHLTTMIDAVCLGIKIGHAVTVNSQHSCSYITCSSEKALEST